MLLVHYFHLQVKLYLKKYILNLNNISSKA